MSHDIFGRSWEEIQALQQGKRIAKHINVNVAGDYGADPIGDGTFRMIPSGDIVDYAERCRRRDGKTWLRVREIPEHRVYSKP